MCVDTVIGYLLSIAKSDSDMIDTCLRTLNVVVFEIGHYLEKVFIQTNPNNVTDIFPSK